MKHSVEQGPLELLAAWYAEAREHPEVRYVGAACLATIDDHDRPDARMVIVREVGEAGCLFATDSRSVKIRQLTTNPNAALTFYWGLLDRSVRIRGRVEEASPADADRCFGDRPRRSKLTVWASHQSRPLESRDDLVARYDEVQERFGGDDDIPRPDTWRAYRLVATEVEFWQAATARLHDRRLFRMGPEGEWQASRLEP
ncbi:MAG: pyridoxamine 5'-phosphate oxidase [Thermoanaerobaculia bacterium]|nr:pyridoxamine 5'-phosphate oxidase [Thermoanaerobaculia bacterium]